MIYGLGIDSEIIERFSSWVGNHKKLNRFLHPIDVEYCSSLPLHRQLAAIAGRFAAKEAFGKALGIGLRTLRLADIAVQTTAAGQPRLLLVNSALQATSHIQNRQCHLSMSYIDTAVSVVVIIECSGVDT